MSTDLSWLYRRRPEDQAFTLADLNRSDLDSQTMRYLPAPKPGGPYTHPGLNLKPPRGPAVPVAGKTDSGSGFGSFSIPSFGGSDTVGFQAGKPPVFSPPLFSVPDANALLTSDPGFQARLKYGTEALENSAAAAGTLNTGNTLAGVTQFGQDYASNEYANVFNRALQAYNTRYQAAKDVFTPKFTAWQQLTGIGEQNALAAFQRQFDLYQLAVTSSLAEQGLITSIALGNTSTPNFPNPNG